MSAAGPGTVLVVAPHADDEVLGCGGTLLRHLAEGDPVHWLLCCEPPPAAARATGEAAAAVERACGFAGVHRLGHPDARLDAVPLAELIDQVAEVFRRVEPAVVYLPHPADAHTDHRVAFDAAAACTKVFRFPAVRRVLAYETPSETDFGLRPDRAPFQPNLFVDVGAFLERKLELVRLYAHELGPHPFPRGEEAVRDLARRRGAAAGCAAAEAFQLLKEIR